MKIFYVFMIFFVFSNAAFYRCDIVSLLLPPYENYTCVSENGNKTCYLEGTVNLKLYVNKTTCNTPFQMKCSEKVSIPATAAQQRNCYIEIDSYFKYYNYKCNGTLNPCQVTSLGSRFKFLDAVDIVGIISISVIVVLIIGTLIVYSCHGPRNVYVNLKEKKDTVSIP